jgi:hypothetical protein
MNIDDVLNQAMLDKTKKALSNAVIQIESLFSMLEPHMDNAVLESLKQQYQDQIVKDLTGG